MDDNNNNNTNTSSTRPTTNVDNSKDDDGVKAPKRGRQSSKKSAPPAEEMLSSPPQKKPAIDVNKEMEQQGEKRAIFQSPPAPVMPSFYNNYHNYAGHGFSHPYAYYGHPSWSPMLSAPPPSPAPMPATMMSPSPFQHKFGWFGTPPIPVATSTPLNPAFVCSSSQMDSSMMDVQKEASGKLSGSVSGEAEHEQSLTEGMWDTTAVGNTKMDLSNSWTSYSNSMEDQSTDKNGQTSSRSSSIADTQVPMLVPNMPITPKSQFGSPYPMFYPPPFGHPTQFSFPPYSTAHLPMPIDQKNQVQPIITKDIEQEHSAKDGNGSIYRNCLVCGDNNYTCGKYNALQVCDGCRQFFKRVAGSSSDRKATFKCSKGSGNCLISKETRNLCQFCRFQACLKAGMEPQKVIELKAKRERNKEHDPSSSQNVNNQQAPSRNADKHKNDYNKTLGLLNKLCETFKAFHLHLRNTEGAIKLDELKKTLCGFMASIFEHQQVEIGEEQCEALVEREFAAFLVIRHVFLDDLPTLKEYCAWNWNNQKENDESDDDNGEKEQMDLLMQKVGKFRRGLKAEFLQAEEQAVLSALALSYPKFVESDEIKKVHAQLMECLYAQTFARNPKAYNAMKRNLEELLNCFEF